MYGRTLTTGTMDYYGTHQMFLIKAVQQTMGPVIELGAGHYSTPLLHAMLSCDFPRRLITVDTDAFWLRDTFGYLQTSWHEMRLCEHTDGRAQWAKMSENLISEFKHAGVVFIDHDHEQERADSIVAWKNVADIVVVHDVNVPDWGLLSCLKKHYEFVEVCDKFMLHTAMASNRGAVIVPY